MNDNLPTLAHNNTEPDITEDIATFEAITHPKKRAFLHAVVEFGTEYDSARAVGVSVGLPFYWKKTDSVYLAAFELAKRAHSEKLIGEAHRRATRRVKPSDNLLMFSIKGVRPEYRDNFQVNIDNRRLTVNVDKGQFDFNTYRGMLGNTTSLLPVQTDDNGNQIK